MQLKPKTYAVVLILTGFLFFGAIVASNVLIDPYGVFFGTGLTTEKPNVNDRYLRYIDFKKSHANVDGLFFASSRGVGIPLSELSIRAGINYANFTVAFGIITDHLPVLERVIKDKNARGERLRQVFLLLDVDFIGLRPHTNRYPYAHLHPDLTGEDPLRFWIQYLAAIQFRAWADNLRRVWWPKPSRTATGNPSLSPESKSPLVQLAAPSAGIAPLDAPVQLNRITVRNEYQQHMALLRRFVELCREHGIELIVATSPLHPELARKLDMRSRAEAVADVSRITPVWDFEAPRWLGSRPELWSDHSHYTADVGRLMLNRIFAGALPSNELPFGELHQP